MSISKTRLRTIKKWADDNAEKEISTLYMEAYESGCQCQAKGDKDFLLSGLIHAIADFAIRFGISSGEITGKIVGLIAEGKRKQEINEGG